MTAVRTAPAGAGAAHWADILDPIPAAWIAMPVLKRSSRTWILSLSTGPTRCAPASASSRMPTGRSNRCTGAELLEAVKHNWKGYEKLYAIVNSLRSSASVSRMATRISLPEIFVATGFLFCRGIDTTANNVNVS